MAFKGVQIAGTHLTNGVNFKILKKKDKRGKKKANIFVLALPAGLLSLHPELFAEVSDEPLRVGK